MDIICKDFNSALHSLSQIMGVPEDKIISVLEYDWEKQYENDERIFIQRGVYEVPFPDDFGDYKLLNGFPDTRFTDEHPTIYWFHGARSIFPDDYLHFGILPLLEMYPKIKQMVDDIALKLNIKSRECKSELQKRHKWLAEFKINDSKSHGGTFAMLIYEAAATPEAFGNHSYIDEPEIITDYAKMVYDTDAEIILSEFKRISTPIIVEFIEPNDSEHISLKILASTVIQYLYRKLHKENVSLQGNICFSNKGKSIQSDLIVKIHRI